MFSATRAAAAAAAVAVVMASSAGAVTPAQPHPGDAITVQGRGGCTLGFLLAGSDGEWYMTTAAHCFVGTTPTKRTWAPGAGPAVETAEGRIGTLTFAEYAVSPETGDNYDFALIRIDKAVRPSPEIRTYGAPTGVNDNRSGERSLLRVYGHGTGVSLISPARQVLAPNTRARDHVYAHGPLFQGDSGAPVIDAQGRAVGTVLGAGVRTASDPQNTVAPNIIGRLSPVLQHASSSLRTRLALVVNRRAAAA